MTWKRPAEDVRVFNAVFVDDFFRSLLFFFFGTFFGS
jgi:hypothetical protein